MRKVISKILFLVGFLIFIFPFVIRVISYLNQTTAIYSYENTSNNMSQEEKENELDKSNKYNEELSDQTPIINMGDENFNVDESVSSFDFLNTGEVIGTLIIPKINVELPIYDGIENDNLQKGVSMLKNTSYPTGEPSTHSVIAGHSGLTRAKILDDLNEIQVGDEFLVEYLGNTNNYEVIDIKVVLPDETDSLQIVEDETLVTLVTCTPKNINTHRLLVTGKITQMPEKIDISIWNRVKAFILDYYLYIIAIVILIVALIVYVIKGIKKRRKKNNNIKINTDGGNNG